jgi:Phosphomethylpyrimidine kinase
VPRALTVAGSDSGGGAGIQADLKTFMARGVFGMSAITAVTAQNSHGVRGVHTVPASFVVEQMDAVLRDLGADVVKTGMIPSAQVLKSLPDTDCPLLLVFILCYFILFYSVLFCSVLFCSVPFFFVLFDLYYITSILYFIFFG